MVVALSHFGRMSRIFFYLEISKQHEVFVIASRVDRRCFARHIIEKDKPEEKEKEEILRNRKMVGIFPKKEEVQ